MAVFDKLCRLGRYSVAHETESLSAVIEHGRRQWVPQGRTRNSKTSLSVSRGSCCGSRNNVSVCCCCTEEWWRETGGHVSRQEDLGAYHSTTESLRDTLTRVTAKEVAQWKRLHSDILPSSLIAL